LAKIIPGFRTGVLWKKIIASVFYFMVFALLLAEGPGYVFAFIILFVPPYLLITNFPKAWRKLPFFKSKPISKKVSGIVLYLLLLLFLISLLLDTVNLVMTPNLSGIFINPDEKSSYVVFDMGTVTFYEDGNQVRSGTFKESAKTESGRYLMWVHEGEGPPPDYVSDERYWLDGKKEIISEAILDDTNRHLVGEVIYIKKPKE
jgi:hypothetical protein